MGTQALISVLNPSSATVTPVVMPSTMMSEPRAPSLVGATPKGSFIPGILVSNAARTAAFLSSGTAWSAVPAPVSTSVALNTSVV